MMLNGLFTTCILFADHSSRICTRQDRTHGNMEGSKELLACIDSLDRESPKLGGNTNLIPNMHMQLFAW